MPDAMPFADAAGIPLVGITALQGLRDRGGLPMEGAGWRVLVVGASGGVGHLAVQIARAAGAEVVGVCSAKNAAMVLGLGANAVVDYAAPNPYDGQAPFDLVLDCVAGDPGPFLPLLTAQGCYASTAPSAVTFLRSTINGLSARKVKPVMLSTNAEDLRILDGLWTAGKLRVVVDRRFPVADLAAAWELSKSGRSTGKIIVDVA
jgi:NADPH:quinone reductase-like Zn-dependent oxidoreductase